MAVLWTGQNEARNKMKRLRAWFLRLGGFFQKDRGDREFSAEMESHLQLHIADNLRAGMSAEEARRNALIKLGGVEQTKEIVRERRGLPMLEVLMQDLRFGARMLRKNAGFTVIGVLTLALGIGTNTVIFSVVNSVLLRPLPYPAPDRIFAVWQKLPQEDRVGFSTWEFQDWVKETQVFESLSAATGVGFTLTSAGEPEMCTGLLATPSIFSVLGAGAALGRTFSPEEGRASNDHVVVLSDGLWKEKFGADPGIVGRTITLNGEPYAVVGVMPRGFAYPSSRYRLWAPLALTAAVYQKYPDAHFLSVIGRLKSGTTDARFETELSLVARRLAERDRNNNRLLRHARLQALQTGEIRRPLLVILSAVGLVLLIACSNVANLFLARATSRRQEIAVRIALGASRLRIVRQLLVESLLVSFLGGGLGLTFAFGGVYVLRGFTPENVPGIRETHLDATVLLFTVLVSAVAALLSGLAPALTGWTPSSADILRHGSRGTGGTAVSRLREALVFGEVALSVVLLISTALMLRSFAYLQSVNPGFRPASVLTAGVAPPQRRYPEASNLKAFFRSTLESLRTMPGVQAVAINTALPFSGQDWGNSVEIEGHPVPLGHSHIVQVQCVSPSYFAAMGIEVRAGREFEDRDSEAAAPVAIIDALMASKFWPGENPIGRRINLDGPWRTIVGVVRTVKRTGLSVEEEPQLYVPYFQLASDYTKFLGRGLFLVIRSSVDAPSLVGEVRAGVRAVDKEIPLTDVSTMEQLLYDSVAEPRFRTFLLSVFSGVALALTCVGIYAVMSYAVTQRRHEIGIRIAIGAERRAILRLILGKVLFLTASSATVGLVISLALSRLLSTLLFGISPQDPVTFAGVPFLLLAVALLSSYLPARRAMRIDPMVALRYE